MSEFARLYPLETIGTAPHAVTITATPEECVALAARFDLQEIGALSAQATLVQGPDGYRARGTLEAPVVQSCVATGGAVPAALNEAFDIRFVPETDVPESEELELDADECDTMFHDGRALDLGEAVAQTLALALDPFPRAADADAILAKAGVVGDDEFVSGPFAALKGLK
jgi:uncharacterized metal-binding protein YceD (DUF177 family)